MKQRNSGRRRPQQRGFFKKSIALVTAKEDANFHAACKAAGIPATKRQWKKWNQRTGRAFAFANQ